MQLIKPEQANSLRRIIETEMFESESETQLIEPHVDLQRLHVFGCCSDLEGEMLWVDPQRLLANL